MIGFRFTFTLSSPDLSRSIGIIISQSEKTLKSTIIQPRKSENYEITLQLFIPDIYLTLPSGLYPLSLYSFFNCPIQSKTYPECTLNIQITPCSDLLYHFTVRGFNLDDLDITSLSDPYFIISCNRNEIYKSEVIMDNLNPEWKQFTIKESLLKDFIVINVWDEDPGAHDFIGACEVSIQDMIGKTIEVDIHNGKKKGNTKSGRLRITVKKVKNLAEKLFEGLSVKSHFLIPCFFDYSKVERVLEVVRANFQFKEISFFGFGSSENYAWKIGDNLQNFEVFADPILSNKNLGPSIAGPILNTIQQELDSLSTNLVFIIAVRDFFDPKTVSWLIKNCKRRNIFTYFLTSSSLSYPNLESSPEAILLKYSEYIGEDLQKQYEKIVNDLDSTLC